MFNLSNPPSGPNLRPHASEANMRGRFGANNGSSLSLAAPAPAFSSNYRKGNSSSSSLALPGPGFSSRFGTQNSSSVSLALPGPVGGSRPGTPSGRTKDWVNPLDVHFARKTPSPLPLVRSPTGAPELQLPPTPREESENGSIFGAEADDVVDSIIQAVKMGEKMADEQEKESRKKQEMGRLEKEKLERQRVAEARVVANPPPQLEARPRPQLRAQIDTRSPGQDPPAMSPSVESPVFRGNIDERPGSRNGMVFGDEEGPVSRSGISGNGSRPQGRPNGSLPSAPADRGHNRQAPRGRGSDDSTGSQSRGMSPHQGNKGFQGPQAPYRHGPPAHGPPTQDLPRIPPENRRGHPGGPGGPRGPPDSRGPPRARGPEQHSNGRPMGPGTGPGAGPGPNGPRQRGQPNPRQHGVSPAGPPSGLGLRGPPPRPNMQRSESPAPPRAPGLRINPHLGSRNQSPAPNHRRGRDQLIGQRSESPAPISPDPEPDKARTYSPAFGSGPYSPAFGPSPYSPGDGDSRPQSPAPSNLGISGPRRQESGSTAKTSFGDEPSLRDLMALSPEPVISPGTTSRSSDDGSSVIEQFARPIIQSVQARRDTLTLNTPRRHSLSMEIEMLEKSLVKAQQTQAQELRASMSSSHYSNETYDTEDTAAALDLEPAPLRGASPLPPTSSNPRDPSPMRGALALRRGPRRPTLDEYGVPGKQLATSAYRRDPINAPSGPPSGPSGSTSPPSRSTTPQFHQPSRPLVTTPTLDPPPPFRALRQIPSTVIEPGFKFDFGTPAAPPTPDSTTWPLASPLSTSPPDVDTVHSPKPQKEPEINSASPGSAEPPPPLSFNFSPEAYSRDPALWTPPLRSSSKGAMANENDGRPSTSQGIHLAAGTGSAFRPSGRSRIAADSAGSDDAAATGAALGIGMARGPSVRDTRRRPPPPPDMVDAFGTGFI